MIQGKPHESVKALQCIINFWNQNQNLSVNNLRINETQRKLLLQDPSLMLNNFNHSHCSPISGGCRGPAGPEDLILLTGPCLGLSAVLLRPRLSGDAVPFLPPGNSGDILLTAPG